MTDMDTPMSDTSQTKPARRFPWLILTLLLIALAGLALTWRPLLHLEKQTQLTLTSNQANIAQLQTQLQSAQRSL